MKKILAWGLVALMLLLICGCSDDGEGPGVILEPETTAEPVPKITSVALTSFTVVRAEKADEKVLDTVAELFSELSQREGGENVQLMDDFLKPGASADSSLPEVLIGMTNRPESTQALEALPGYLDFSVGMVGQKLCIAANTAERLADAAAYFLENLSTENGVLTYTGGQYVGRAEYPMSDATPAGQPLSSFVIVYPAGSVTEAAAAEKLSLWFGMNTGVCLPVVDDGASEQACEILLGKTARSGSVDPSGLASKSYYIGLTGNKLVLSTASAVGYNAILNRLEELMKNDLLKGDFSETETYAAASLDGARVMFVGNSFTYYGNCTATKNEINLNDNGYFKKVAEAMGDDVTVTSVTYGGAVLQPSSGSKKCLYDVMIKAYPNHYGKGGEMDEFYRQDVVIIQQAGENPSNNDPATRRIMALFPPETQFCFLIHHHNVQKNHTYVLNTAKALRDEGKAIYLPAGHLIHEVWTGKMKVPGGTQKYNQDSFCVNQENDRHHPNYLNGYLTALTVYHAVTGKSIMDSPYDFVSTSLQYYKNGATSNYPDILASEADMTGLKQLVEQYVEEYN